MLKKIISVFLIISLLFAPAFTVGAYEPTGFSISADAALLISLDTGETLYSKNEDKKVYPASITKIMTALLILESEKYNPEAKVTMTREALRLISGTGSVVSNLEEGEQITQLDLLYLVLLASCGDCAYLAASYYGGSVDEFVDMMNTRAKELGMENTNYQNPVGLHHEDNYTTAADTYKLTAHALKNKTFKEVCETTRYTVAQTNMSPATTFSTTNYLQDSTTEYFYTYAKGVRNGFTDEAGRCLVSTASYNGYNYMCLLFGCPFSSSNKYEYTESRELYRWAFNNFEFKQVADNDNPVAEIEVDLSLQTDFVSLYVEDGFVSILPKEADDSTIMVVPHPTNEIADAPIKKGDVLGTADIIYAEQLLGTVNLVSHEDIDRSLMLTVWRGITDFFTSSYMKVVYILAAVLVIVFIVAVYKLNSKKANKRKVKYVPYNKHEEEKPRKRH